MQPTLTPNKFPNVPDLETRIEGRPGLGKAPEDSRCSGESELEWTMVYGWILLKSLWNTSRGALPVPVPIGRVSDLCQGKRRCGQTYSKLNRSEQHGSGLLGVNDLRTCSALASDPVRRPRP